MSKLLNMVPQIQIVTVGKDGQKSKDVLAKVTKDLEKNYTLIHVAHCESKLSTVSCIETVKHVLQSLVVPPKILVCLPGIFDEEAEEVREVANRIAPEMKLIVIPDDLDLKDVGAKKETDLVEYLKEQVENLFG
ncbi:hypothetical protein BDZ45DRAFT_736098 [Acephala macrosclerotiorum]|nr:hypothetical protein BDZ45DRAFT_736098 [Acephala macrosclerotiorum]